MQIVSYIDLSSSIHKVHISDIAGATIKMVTDSIDAFVKLLSLKLAEEVIQHDDVVDGHCFAK